MVLQLLEEQPPSGKLQNDPAFQARHEESLSTGSFLRAYVRSYVLPAVGAAIGGALGYFTLKTPMSNMMGKMITESPRAPNVMGGFVGAVFGGVLGALKLSYENWRRDESTRLAAQEVNHAILQLEMFKPTDAELVAENQRLRDALAKEDGRMKVAQPQEAGSPSSTVSSLPAGTQTVAAQAAALSQHAAG
jgi:hypothetical protein